MPDADAPNPGNPIHSSDSARDYGFRAALVGGATIYGWCVPAIIDAAGMAWLDHGWVDVAFRRPVFPDDRLDLRIDADGSFEVRGDDTRVRIDGHLGLGDAPWLSEHYDAGVPFTGTRGRSAAGADAAERPCGPRVARASRAAVAHRRRNVLPRKAGRTDGVLLRRRCAHPSRVARESTDLRATSLVQLRSGDPHEQSHPTQRGGRVGGDLVVRGRCVDAFERNGHHYIVNDVDIADANEESLAAIRHTAIYRVAKAGP